MCKKWTKQKTEKKQINSIPYWHKQQELIHSIGMMIFLFQTNNELQTKNKYYEWNKHMKQIMNYKPKSIRRHIKTIINFINECRLKDLNKK